MWLLHINDYLEITEHILRMNSPTSAIPRKIQFTENLNIEAESGVNDEDAKQDPRQGCDREKQFLTDDVNRRLKYLNRTK